MLPAAAPPPGVPTLTRAQARAIWSVIAVVLVVAVVGALAGAAAIPADPRAPPGTLFLLIAAPVVGVDLALAYVITGRMRRRSAPGAPAGAVAGAQVIVASAVALGATVLCCVFFFVSREPLLLALVVPCAAVHLHWYPSLARWTAISPGASATPRQNRLVRS